MVNLILFILLFLEIGLYIPSDLFIKKKNYYFSPSFFFLFYDHKKKSKYQHKE